MPCPGMHCAGCGRNGLAGLAALGIGGAIAYHALTSAPVERAITVGLIVIAAGIGLAVLAVIVGAALALRARMRARGTEPPAMSYRAEPVAEPGREYPPLRLVSTRALPAPAPGRVTLNGWPLYGSQEPAGARSRPGRGRRP